MSLIMMFLLIVLFLILLLLSIIFKKKILLYVFLCMAAIIGFVFILMNTVFYFNADSIIIMKNASENGSFSIKAKNHCIRYAGTYMEFSCRYSKPKLYEEISKQYDNIFFDEQFNQVVIINDNEIYAVREHGSSDFLWLKKYNYSLLCSYVSFDLNVYSPESEYVDIPFPGIVLISNRGLIEEDMKIKCDFEHLKQYYENFTNVKIGDNTIEIMLEKYKCIITVNGENAHFEIIKIPLED